MFTRHLQTGIKRTLDKNQPRELAGIGKGYSTPDHLQALKQVIEKSNEYNLPPCIVFKKADISEGMNVDREKSGKLKVS